LSRWRIGVVTLLHVGINALRLGIAALARRERARDGDDFKRLDILA
jgi:hypothetical protein